MRVALALAAVLLLACTSEPHDPDRPRAQWTKVDAILDVDPPPEPDMTTTGAPLWQIIIAEEGSSPRVVFHKAVALQNLRWEEARIAADYRAASSIQSPLLGKRVLGDWSGVFHLQPDSGVYRLTPDRFPRLDALRWRLGSAGIQVVTPDKLLLSSYTPEGTGIYVDQDEGTRELQLKGVDIESAELTANGEYLFIRAVRAGAAGSPTDYYVMPIEAKQAQRVPDVIQIASRSLYNMASSSTVLLREEPRTLLLQAGAIAGEVDMLIFDSENGRFTSMGPFEVGADARVHWHYPDRNLAILRGSTQSLQVDLSTGETTSVSFRNDAWWEELPSPGGARVLRMQISKAAPHASASCYGPARLEVVEARSDATQVLTECQTPTLSYASWIDARHVVLHRESPDKGRGFVLWADTILIDTQTGHMTTLLESDQMPTAFAHPAGDRFILAGDHLEVRSLPDGALVESLGPLPNDYRKMELAWRPDGKAFALLLSWTLS